MENKIKDAISYYLRNRHRGDDASIKNDAANIFADNYEEYLILWGHLTKV